LSPSNYSFFGFIWIGLSPFHRPPPHQPTFSSFVPPLNLVTPCPFYGGYKRTPTGFKGFFFSLYLAFLMFPPSRIPFPCQFLPCISIGLGQGGCLFLSPPIYGFGLSLGLSRPRFRFSCLAPFPFLKSPPPTSTAFFAGGAFTGSVPIGKIPTELRSCRLVTQPKA